MNIDKINATLSKAIVHIQEGEAEGLRKHALGESEDVELSPLEEAIHIVAQKVAETAGIDEDKAIDAVSEVLGEAAAKNLAGQADLTEEDIVTWLSQQSGLVESVTEHLKAA